MSRVIETFRGNALLAICAAGLFLAALAMPAAAQGARREYAEALQQYKDGRLSEAYGRFVALATSGDADAARIAIFMHRYGPALYGRYWDLSPQQEESWASLVNGPKWRTEAPPQTSLLPERASPKRAANPRKEAGGLTAVALPRPAPAR